MTILDRIVIDKIKEVALRKKIFPTSYWEQSPLFERAGSSLAQNLKNSSSGIIAEHKRRSPSRDNINSSLSVHEVAEGVLTNSNSKKSKTDLIPNVIAVNKASPLITAKSNIVSTHFIEVNLISG